MRPGVACLVLAILLAGCGSDASASDEYRAHVDACKLLNQDTLQLLAAGLPGSATDSATPPSITADVSTCKRGFGNPTDVVLHGSTKSGNTPGSPAYRYVSVEAQRFDDRGGQSGLDRARYFLQQYSTPAADIGAGQKDFEQKYTTFEANGISHATLWAITKNLVVHIEYGGGNIRSVPDGIAEQEARDGVQKLTADAAARLPKA
ncbi:hypothetical protein EV192_1011078 [Actinocrispum wychmicini]|uniref:Lipoprotein n=2 Tax=Actinocrispum wychmicini TaxID=1213861 RepID=A0A4V2S8X9_9PSEU|nr:hypothetical protein EV192_1011078 [Actinocrispum wychmicini]